MGKCQILNRDWRLVSSSVDFFKLKHVIHFRKKEDEQNVYGTIRDPNSLDEKPLMGAGVVSDDGILRYEMRILSGKQLETYRMIVEMVPAKKGGKKTIYGNVLPVDEVTNEVVFRSGGSWTAEDEDPTTTGQWPIMSEAVLQKI